jgi:sterol desaturase/sphingolipid hydroxylase (fatty acid hydroxylase superfamily)
MPLVPAVWEIIVSTLPAVKTYFIAVFFFTLAEALFPAERRQPFRNHAANLAYVVLYLFLTPFAMILPTALATGAARTLGSGLLPLDLEHVSLGLPWVDWPLRNLFLPLLPLLVVDFFYYWHHRWQHNVPSLWAIHRLHHTTESVNALAALRIHWLEEPMRVLTITIPMALVFQITPVEGAWIAFALAQLGIFIHANVRLPFGRLTPLFTGPQLHRLHHSSKPEHLDRNFAAIFPLWDILFGTYVPPRRGEWPETGLGAGQRAGSIAHETAFPFMTWGRNLRGWAAGKG